MLNSLSIKNYALIDFLEVDFNSGLSVITGETGAGKSIILGALSLVLGRRADPSLVYDKSQKCIVEANFWISNYDLQNFFKEEDLDFDELTTLRREILPNGKSRAFINDTPVNLSSLNALSEKLIDIHSQHETLQLAETEYQFNIIDGLAGQNDFLQDYSSKYLELLLLKKELIKIEGQIEKDKLDFAYNDFILKELNSAQLKIGELEILEEELEKLSHAEEILIHLAEALKQAENEEIGLKDQLHRFRNSMDRISKYGSKYQEIAERIQSVSIELDDITHGIEQETEQLDLDPKELEKINYRIRLLYDLFKKHQVNSVSELLEIKEIYEKKVNGSLNADQLILEKQKKIDELTLGLGSIAGQISENRKKCALIFCEELHKILEELEMPNTQIKIKISPTDDFTRNGKDQLEFLISSDGGKSFELVKKVASGGEISRIMLAVKFILSKHTHLPTIIFDEIDTGVSGEVSNKIGKVMKEMSKRIQVLTITHLPQVAAQGEHHYKVFKTKINDLVRSNIIKLNSNGRVEELAEMLGGKSLTGSAVAHAKALLKL